MKFNKICILGLGYIGLPTAAMFANKGVHVVGVDINSLVVETLKRGDIHIKEVGLLRVVQQAIASGCLAVHTAPEPADAFIIAVPTPIRADKTADMHMVQAAAEMITLHLRPGNLVILESTSPPHTTTDLVKPILERSGLVAGRDFSLAYSPERVLPGQILKELIENARVIGGIDKTSAEAGRDLYSIIVRGDILLTDATTAEMVKLMENTYRDVNIALANEFALVAEEVGVNVWEAIEIANRHPRVKILKPGPGVGGHCIAVDPWFLVEAVPEVTQVIHHAREVNDGMPHHVVALVKALTGPRGANGDRPRIAVLGVAYKSNVDDVRESPAIEVVKHLRQNGFEVRLNDPLVEDRVIQAELGMSSLPVELAATDADCLLLLTDHDAYKALNPNCLSGLMHRKLIVDTRRCLDLASWRQAGFETILLGKGTQDAIVMAQTDRHLLNR